MPTTLNFKWQANALKQHVHNATYDALIQTEADAQGWFQLLVPIGTTGALSRTFWSYITDTGGYWVTLVYGMGGMGTRQAVYIELGTSKMAPRAPLRTTAMQVVPLIPYHLQEALAKK